MAFTEEQYKEYSKRILGKMKTGEHGRAVKAAVNGDFDVLGCFDYLVQGKHPTDLAIAGGLIYFAQGRRGGIPGFLMGLMRMDKVDKSFEIHKPCGDILLEHGLVTWADQTDYTNKVESLVYGFNEKYDTSFGILTHPDIGTADPFMLDRQ